VPRTRREIGGRLGHKSDWNSGGRRADPKGVVGARNGGAEKVSSLRKI